MRVETSGLNSLYKDNLFHTWMNIAFLGFVRLRDKHNIQLLYVQVFRSLFRNKYIIFFRIITIAFDYQANRTVQNEINIHNLRL